MAFLKKYYRGIIILETQDFIVSCIEKTIIFGKKWKLI